MTNLREIIEELREVQTEKGLSYNQILKIMEENGDYGSKSTLSRLFGDYWEDYSFDYEKTIRPIAKALLGMEHIEETDDMDTKAMKSLLKYKIRRMEELEREIASLKTALDKEKVKYHEKLDAERERYNKSIDFLKEQVAYKDKRMDMLLEAVFEKDKQHKEMLAKILMCSKCPMEEKNEG